MSKFLVLIQFALLTGEIVSTDFSSASEFKSETADESFAVVAVFKCCFFEGIKRTWVSLGVYVSDFSLTTGSNNVKVVSKS